MRCAASLKERLEEHAHYFYVTPDATLLLATHFCLDKSSSVPAVLYRENSCHEEIEQKQEETLTFKDNAG
jgi:hypothetical protein